MSERQQTIDAMQEHLNKPNEQIQAEKKTLLKTFAKHGENTPASDLIKLLDIAVNEDKLLTMPEVAEDIGAYNANALNAELDKFIALKQQFDRAGDSVADKDEPDLLSAVKQPIASHLKRVYQP